MAPTWDQKSMLTWDGDFSTIVLWLKRGLVFSYFANPSWEQTSIKNRSKKHVNMRRHLGLDFSSILVDFGSQVGPKLAPKTKKKWSW